MLNKTYGKYQEVLTTDMAVLVVLVLAVGSAVAHEQISDALTRLASAAELVVLAVVAYKNEVL